MLPLEVASSFSKFSNITGLTFWWFMEKVKEISNQKKKKSWGGLLFAQVLNDRPFPQSGKSGSTTSKKKTTYALKLKLLKRCRGDAAVPKVTFIDKDRSRSHEVLNHNLANAVGEARSRCENISQRIPTPLSPASLPQPLYLCSLRASQNKVSSQTLLLHCSSDNGTAAK